MDFYIGPKFEMYGNPTVAESYFFVTTPNQIKKHQNLNATATYYEAKNSTLDGFHMESLKARKTALKLFNLTAKALLKKDTISTRDLRCAIIYVDTPEIIAEQTQILTTILTGFGIENDISWFLLPHPAQYDENSLDNPHYHVIWHKSTKANKRDAVQKYFKEYQPLLKDKRINIHFI